MRFKGRLAAPCGGTASRTHTKQCGLGGWPEPHFILEKNSCSQITRIKPKGEHSQVIDLRFCFTYTFPHEAGFHTSFLLTQLGIRNN
jgi:hypothetical protein